MKTINFAIDLGTTNSLIAKYEESTIILYNNPLGLKQTLPSCIAFRGNRTIIGDKALDYLEKDAENVCMLFKRKMGSSETFYVPSIDREISPIELSSLILKELKNFVTGTEILSSLVITIPASFDTIQSNATKKAGYLAGFEEVVLLQEPIAACFAFANKANLEITEPKKWIVYDFGGGTFDVALVEIDDRELKVIDNVGDNFLGGADIDNLIVEKIIVPYVEEILNISNLWKDIKAKSSRYKGLYFELLKKAEEAKKELSIHQETEVELDFEIEGKDIYEHIVIKRKQFENIIHTKVTQTIDFIKMVMSQNQLISSQIERVILIGGTTYIPLVKQRIKDEIGILVDTSINPTSAVVEGAAYYAGSKPIGIIEKVSELTSEEQEIECKMFFEQSTRDLEELITCNVISKEVLRYRIIRKDGGFDSGVKVLENGSFSEFVPLLEGRLNNFKIQLLDDDLNVKRSFDSVTINQGSYNIQGQPLPNDICMEVDDIDASVTRLDTIFAKGSILPLKKKIYKTASKTIIKESSSNLVVNIIEGKANGLPSSGLSIGFIEISGKQLEEDLLKGTDIEIEIEVTESRDLKVSVYLQSCDQEFENIFSESERSISIKKMNLEINTILSDVEEFIRNNNTNEDFEFSQKLEDIIVGLIEVQIQTTLLDDDDVTDQKYQLDDQKRNLIHKFDTLTRNQLIATEIDDYNMSKDTLEYLLNKEGNEVHRSKYSKIIQNEKEVINSLNKYLIRAKIKELNELYSNITQSKDETFIQHYIALKLQDNYSNTEKAAKLFEQGDQAIDKKDYKVLRFVVYGLYALLPDSEKDNQKTFKDDSKTGLR